MMGKENSRHMGKYHPLMHVCLMLFALAGSICPLNGVMNSAIAGGWEMQSPLQAADDMRHIRGSSMSDVFVVGSGGAILHYDGSRWRAMTSGTPEPLNSVWVASMSRVFAAGDGGTMLHYNGGSWTSITSGTTQALNGVWGASRSNIFAVGDGGTILRYDGGRWMTMASGTPEALKGVWGSSMSNVFVVGDDGALLRYDGGRWNVMDSGTDADLHGVWGASMSHVFAVGAGGTIRHYDGRHWSSMDCGTTETLHSVWGSSMSNVFVVGSSGTILHYDGGHWKTMDSGAAADLHGVWGSSMSNVFAVGDGGTILRYDGGRWMTMASGTPEALKGVWGSSMSNVFVVGDDGALLHYDGGHWKTMDSGAAADLHGVWGSSMSNVFAVGDGGTILRYDGIMDDDDQTEDVQEGDMNNDGLITLTDAVLALKCCAGLEPNTGLNPAADVNGDDKIGLAEALYVLRDITGIAPLAGELVKSTIAYNNAPSYAEADLDTLVSGFTDFTIDFYHALADQPANQGHNLFFSAYSIENALAMTWAGAKHTTADEMAAALHYNLSQDRFHPTLNALNIDINSRDDEPPPSGDAFQLNLVNAIWSRIGYPFLPSYLDVIAQNYDAGVRTLDFVSNPDGSRQVINQWVEDQTHDKIPDLLPPNSISSLTAVVLTNAIYFKGSWYQKFDGENTKPGDFTRLNGTTVTADMMHQTLDTRYFKGQGVDAVALPYVSPRYEEYQYPEELSMLVIVPDKDQFGAVENDLDASRIDAIVNSLQMGEVQLTLPKFEFEFDVKCKEIMHEMGMTEAFDPNAADFSGMVDPGNSKPWIDEIYHKAFVAVDEEGTEAAAATAVVMTDTAIPDPVTISADKPFIFLIRDNVTGAILFMGRVLDPVS